MENFRSFGIAGEEARCGDANCTTSEDFSLTASICANQDDLPSDLLANTDSRDLSFIERNCCTPTAQGRGTFVPYEDSGNDICVTKSLAEQSGDSQMSVAAITGAAVGGTVFMLAVIGGFIFIRFRRRNSSSSGTTKPDTNAVGMEQSNANVTVMEHGHATVSPPPPTAPHEVPIPTAIGHPVPVPTQTLAPNTYRISYGK
jgi:hypothetical protein